LLDVLTGAGYLPVIACVGESTSGQIFNVNGDSMAVAVASGWRAERLVFLTDVPGVLDEQKQRIPVLTAAGCRDLIESGVASGGMQAKLNAAIQAVSGGVKEVRIVRGSDVDIVTRVFAGEEAGTRVVQA
jgi:acetylglutamate kinase